MTRMDARRVWRCVSAAVAALILSGTVMADTIVLRNGNRIVGRIERREPGPSCAKCGGEGDIGCTACSARGMIGTGPCSTCKASGRLKCPTCMGRGHGEACYVIRLRGGVSTTIPESEVASIERSEIASEDLLPVKESYAERVKKIGDPEDEMELAEWALAHDLLQEASKHARHAAQELPELASRARKIAVAAERRIGAEASRTLTAAFGLIRSLKYEEGAVALKAAVEEHADNPLLANPELLREFLAENASDIVGEYGSTLDAICRAVATKARTACDTCLGAGISECPKCKGASEGMCSRCRGSGRSWCPECNGTNWRLCISCGGTGRTTTIAMGTPTPCIECRGRGVIACRRCRSGRISCPTCGGNGRIPGGCTTCGGKGTLECPACRATGQKRVDKMLWGAVAELSDAGDAKAKATSVWQGVRRGCIITLVRSTDIHGGAFTSHLAALAGKRYEVLLACIDNRDGRDQVRFRPGEQGLRIVTRDARQLESERPDIADAIEDHPEYGELLSQLKPTAVLPGVLQNVAAVFPAGTDFQHVDAVYWGREDPWRLKPIAISQEQMDEIVQTLH